MFSVKMTIPEEKKKNRDGKRRGEEADEKQGRLTHTGRKYRKCPIGDKQVAT